MLFMVVPRKRVCPSHSLAYHDLTQSIALYGKTAITGSGGDNAIHGSSLARECVLRILCHIKT